MSIPSSSLDYPSVRQQKLALIKSRYEKVLQDYVMLYNMNSTNPGSVSQDQIVAKNNELISIAQQMYSNNEFTQKEVNNIYSSIDAGDISVKNKYINDQIRNLSDKNTHLATNASMVDQYTMDYRRYHIVYIVNIILLILLLLAFIFFCLKFYQQLYKLLQETPLSKITEQVLMNKVH